MLSSIKLPNTVEEIKVSAFHGCPNLTSLTIPKSVTKLDDRFIVDCTGLQSIHVDELNENYFDVDGHSVVSKSGNLMQVVGAYPNSEYTLDERITTVLPYAFSSNINITTLNLNENVSSIGFYNTKNISYVNLNNNLHFKYVNDEYGNKFLVKTNEGSKAYLCTLSLSTSKLHIIDTISSVEIFRPANVMNNYITTMEIGENFNFDDSTFGSAAFQRITYYQVNSNNKHLKTLSNDEVLSFDGKIMYCYAQKSLTTEYTIPDSVEDVRANFMHSTSLIKLTYTSSVKTTTGFVLRVMDKLTDLVLSGSLPNYTGNSCVNLRHVTLLSTVTSIGHSFLSQTVNNIEWLEFQSTTVPTINTTNFLKAVKSKTTFVIYVPDASVDAYKNATAFANFVDRIKPVSERPSA